MLAQIERGPYCAPTLGIRVVATRASLEYAWIVRISTAVVEI